MFSTNKVINRNGYSMPLNAIPSGKLEEIKKDLTIIPIDMTTTMKMSKTEKQEDKKEYKIWRESNTKIYVPRFYGLDIWGNPESVSLPLGEQLELSFKGNLREIQVPIVNKVMNHFNDPQNNLNGNTGVILELYCAIGKTVCALNIISKLKCKTLIMVHKEFLMNQWIERATEFLPNVRIGKIQSTTFDIENKDIVIGMVQTMYNRDYDANTFNSFGLTIFDEVHRFGSGEFSKIFFNVSTKYMLGITATLTRKDGTTPILHHFIGPVIYTITDRGKESVTVLGISYSDYAKGGDNAKYLEMQHDFRGNPKYSTMITTICSYKPRTNGIYTIIKNVVQKYHSAQIMILSHNLSLLNDLEKCILEDTANPTPLTYGYYVGGMKKKALNETENKQLVLATFAMAQEALDIKTLSILILASSKTDIIQSVGRILRDKGQTPKMVIDIIDNNTTFVNQWNKRLKYYKSCDYSIYKSTSWANYLQSPFGFLEMEDCDKITSTLHWKKVIKRMRKCSTKVCENDDYDNNDSDEDGEKNEKKGVCLI